MDGLKSVTRRRFLTWTGVTAAGALAVGATQVNWSDLLAAAQHDPLPPGAGVLVVVTLYGGNDGLNTVVPAADRAYQDARPDLAYKPEEVLDLGEGLGLNPGLKGMRKLWDTKNLAIVRGVGYPQPDHSHFRSMAIWQTASPQSPGRTGWLGRWLDVTGDDPLRALSVEPVLPPLLAGERAAGACLPPSGLQIPKGALGQSFLALGKPQAGEGTDYARAAKSITDLSEAAKTFGDAHAKQQKGASALGTQLDLVAGLIETGVPTRAYSVSLGGFDTHADERGTQQRLLSSLDSALTAFVERMGKSDRGKDVVVLVYSEFGRRVQANASDGTDHGTAGPAFVLGPRVNGGFHGQQPSLTDLDKGDLKETTDFRDIYATLIDRVLGTDPGPILGDHPGRLDALLP
ncbi:uncharacterized protein (DUF1501 family) [Actinocrispum wychmicini]|uniref:Uncharacterized protein (DUF1501 family) n=1 Tax=Actinocrispum wychmicini TaxID=1213861 RepID=A0A4R2JT63_9PSEU|nr:DUF1501 domain-containing protein [Actinocrispum wychmicini]TCO60436.1 uncharacterized protein (DUF1501 family) [Actinocrispum wychmicini]